jgi:exonuclease SbcD
MRFIHSSDWHLGRLFFGESLTGEQAALLQELVIMAKDLKPDAILVSGDVYDRSVPPADAVSLLDDVLSKLVLDCRIPVLMIAGNHDSGTRLAFGQRILEHKGLHVCSSVLPEKVALFDQWGQVEFVMVPYAETASVRLALEQPEATDPDSAMQCRLADYCHETGRSVRRVAMAHAFLAGGQASESERPLSVGGTGAVSAVPFAGFDYVALGHLHRPQKMEAGRLSYSGSLMKYSFDEAKQAKGIYLVEIDRAGALSQEFFPLPIRRDVRIVEGFFADLMAGPQPGQNPEDFLSVVLWDETPVIQAIHRLRSLYPKTMEINYRYQLEAASFSAGRRPDHRSLSGLDLFDSFAEWSAQKPLTPEQRETMAAFLTETDSEGGIG